MFDVLLFAGTSEGRDIAAQLAKGPLRALALTATAYGASLLPASDYLTVRAGRLNEAGMRALLGELRAGGLVVDATHPYAALATENIRVACRALRVRYVRVNRETGGESAAGCAAADGEMSACGARGAQAGRAAAQADMGVRQTPGPAPVYVENAAAAVAYLAGTSGRILLTTGSKDLATFMQLPGAKERLYARILSTPEAVAAAAALGLVGRHLICMQGPFSAEMNRAALHHTGAAFLVTKDTGVEGGFPEKAAAARDCGCQLVILRRPQEVPGLTVSACLALLQALARKEQARAQSQ